MLPIELLMSYLWRGYGVRVAASVPRGALQLQECHRAQSGKCLT